ncbi:MAG: efflux RND transporter periplasmic adaptor subunit [Phycisphaerales bacterium]|nr:efflux RND transporter periplasmic adaptor subunit [Phycisphaerales bacterium]
MKKLTLMAVLGVSVTAGAVGLILAARHYGWPPLHRGNGPAAASGVCLHGIGDDRCPFCNPELIGSMGVCGEHGVAEALCTRCHPALIGAFKAANDWCAEHGVPESQCTLCGGGRQIGSASGAVTSAGASSTPVAMRANRIPSETCTNAFSTVQLQSPEIARRAGFELVTLRSETVDETILCNAEVAYDGDSYAHLASRAQGSVVEVSVSLGAHVEAGQVLAIIDSAELGSAKAAFLQAQALVELWQKNEARERVLFDKNVGTEKDVLEAETKVVESRVQLSSAQQRLRNLGLSPDDIARVAEENDTSSYLRLRAPFDGVIVERNAVTGEVVDTTDPLFALADTSKMWVMLDVYESEVARLRHGQVVNLTIDAMSGRTFDGVLTWVSSQVDPRTRTIRARAEMSNPDGLLRANMFGRAGVRVRTIDGAVLVPESAVQWDGCCNLVFVRQTDTVYQPYKVVLGYKRDGHYVVEDGLLAAGDSVVTQGSFLLKTEILKGSIGAGCCEVDPGANK